jgi:hypothetical protein
LKVLLGLDVSMLGAWWFFSGGRSGGGSQLFSRSAYVSIFFFFSCFGRVLAAAPAFSFVSDLWSVVSCVCYINIAGRNACFEKF